MIGDDLRALIGSETETFLGEITLREIQRYAAAVGDLNPLYFDEDYARASAYGGIVAPPNYLTAIIGWAAGPPESGLTPDGCLPDPIRPILRGMQRAMGAGQELAFGAPVRPGDRITRVSRIAGVTERAGRSGPFVVITFEERYVNQHGSVAVECRASVIVR